MKLADYVAQAREMKASTRRQGIRDLLPRDPQPLVALMMERPVELFYCDAHGNESIVGAMRRVLENHIIRQIDPSAPWG